MELGATGGCCPSLAAPPRPSAMSAATGMRTLRTLATPLCTRPSASESAKEE